MPGVRRSYIVLLAALPILSAGSYPTPLREELVIRGMDQAQADREAHLNGYTVTEHYMIHNLRFQTAAEMTVATVYSNGTGKSYQTLSRSGSPTLQNSVLEKLLREEVEMSRGDTRQHALITSANYKMKLIGQEIMDGRTCDILELVPRTKSAHFLKGRAWVDSEDRSLVRIEGKPSASPSFWAGRPTIVREYERIDGFTVAKRSHAISDSLLLGKTELTIEYSHYALTATARQ
jgi:hypothetical protein